MVCKTKYSYNLKNGSEYKNVNVCVLCSDLVENLIKIEIYSFSTEMSANITKYNFNFTFKTLKKKSENNKLTELKNIF